MNDLETGDDEYWIELQMAMDDLPGEFAVFEGAHETRPETAPLLVEGEPGDPIHWEHAR